MSSQWHQGITNGWIVIGPPNHPIASYGLRGALLDISEGLYHTLKGYVAGLLVSIGDDDNQD